MTERKDLMSNPNPRRWLAWLGLLALAGYTAFLATKTTAIAGGADSSGYLNSARLLAGGEWHAPMRMPPEFHPLVDAKAMDFTPLGFLPSRTPGHVTPTYPTGLPLHFALFGKLFGWETGPWLLEVLVAAATLWLTYAVARRLGIGAELAFAGAAVLAVFPVFLFTSIQAMSDTLATTWVLAAVYGALRARDRVNWAAACGAAFAIAVLVRPTNIVVAPAILVLLGLDWRKLARFVLSGLPGAAWFLWYNQRQYGHPFETGYGDVGAAFSWIYGVPTALHFGYWLAVFLPAVLLALPIATLFRRDTRNRELAALALWFVSVTGLYLFYDCSHDDWWWLRFIVPATPALIIAGMLGIEALARGPAARWPRIFRPAAAAVIVVWALANSWYWTPRLHVFLVQRYEQAYADASRLAAKTLPQDAVVAAIHFSGSLYFYTDFAVLRADLMNEPTFQRYVDAARQARRPICAVLFEFEEEDALRTRCPGNWKQIGGIHNVRFWQLEP